MISLKLGAGLKRKASRALARLRSFQQRIGGKETTQKFLIPVSLGIEALFECLTISAQGPIAQLVRAEDS